MTYGFFMNHTKDSMSSYYFMNKNNPVKKVNKFKSSTKSVSSMNKSKNSSKVNHKKKKELLEEIITANSNSIKNNNFFKTETDSNLSNRMKMFTIEKLYTNKEEDIHIENKIERKRKEVIAIHNDLINSHISGIMKSLEAIITKKKTNFFIKNRYFELLEEYTN